MKLANMLIDVERLDRITSAPRTRASAGEGRSRVNGRRGRGGAYVTAEVLAETGRNNPECRCEDLGLRAGMPTSELITLEEGCTEHVKQPRQHWVCNRLDTVRRRYGL